jgi:ABC-2 type transport system permease protein
MYVRTLRQAVRRPVHLTFSLLQPLMWLIFFTAIMERATRLPLAGGADYRAFLLPGIAAMTALFGASQAGVGLIRDLQTGMLQRMLATPASRGALHAGRTGADATRLVLQAAIVLAAGAAVGIPLRIVPVPLLAALATLFAFAIAFGSLSAWIALRTGRQETMASFIHVVNMPIFFTSTALAPRGAMPDWLAAIAALNPLSPVVDAMRAATVAGTMPNVTATLLPTTLLAVLGVAVVAAELQRGLRVGAWAAR